jgi:hypothetical protein
MGWAGWGAGPSGAGAAGGPSRLFLAVALAGSAVVAGVLAKDGKVVPALLSGLATVYFALRLTGRIGGRRGE